MDDSSWAEIRNAVELIQKGTVKRVETETPAGYVNVYRVDSPNRPQLIRIDIKEDT